jgi:L-alanine-DL-glutamate epimerase-like enolase superfamily enzyme
MPKIQGIQFCHAAVPLDKVTYLSTRTVTERHYGLVRVRSTDGAEGIGFCYVGNAGGAIFEAVVESLLGPVLLGRDSHQVEGLWREMYQHALLQGRAGTVMRAVSALDIALWDLNARSAGLPLHRLMGAVELQSVPAYASGGYYVDGKTPSDLAREVASYVEMGFDAVKIKAGRYSPSQEEARVQAAREAIGPDVALMLDMNNAWVDVPQAMQYVRRFERHDPYFLEEPFSPDDVDNHVRLAQLTRVPVATAEIGYGRWYHKELLQRGAATILQTDACVCGGITEWKRIAATAASHGVVVCPHWFHDVHAPLVASTPNARWVEFFQDDQVLNFRRLIDRQMDFRGGRVLLHDAPGLGFGFDETALTRWGKWKQL